MKASAPGGGVSGLPSNAERKGAASGAAARAGGFAVIMAPEPTREKSKVHVSKAPSKAPSGRPGQQSAAGGGLRRREAGFLAGARTALLPAVGAGQGARPGPGLGRSEPPIDGR